jgi:N-glycosylase/DNA lyase
MEGLQKAYSLKKEGIRKRLEEFKEIKNASDEKIFYELCYCIMTANGSATSALKAQEFLEEKNYWKIGNIGTCLSSVRFAPKKCEYINSNRKHILEDNFNFKNLLKQSPYEIREFIVKDKSHFKGLGYKEASHFLRNIGLGEELAILDRHILRNLKKYEVIEEIPKSLTRKKYLEIEKKMKEFSKKINIPLTELDLLFWSEETGKILK